jgi:hypothetical protein
MNGSFVLPDAASISASHRPKAAALANVVMM